MPAHKTKAETACASCGSLHNTTDLHRVPWFLQIAALPITAIFILSRLCSPSFLLGFFFDRSSPTEFFHRYCPRCRRRQIICHWIVAIWSATFVAFLLVQNRK
ncbi:hypothetical protein [Rhodopirellula bahusiensis]|uniref:hypothetical protein n=1 Tax=Rhodopirellula bahusiensis TaxID=2014065 RepID=UPI00326649E1